MAKLLQQLVTMQADSQIKSRGYRIVLGEIDTALNALGLLRECAVVAIKIDGFEGMGKSLSSSHPRDPRVLRGLSFLTLNCNPP
jgi:hypothetical protein